MKILVVSDIHGSNYYMKKIEEIYQKENADRIILLGDLYYHGPRNPLPKDYNPMEVSKKLNKVISVEWKKGDLKNYIEEIRKRNIPLVSVQFPKSKEKLSTSYINSNWKVTKRRIEDVVFFAKPEEGKYVFVCNNEKLATELVESVKILFLDAEYVFTKADEQNSVIIKKIFKEGMFSNREEIAKVSANKYSVARCFA